MLNQFHPEGRTKAAFFIRLEFDPGQPDVLRQALLHLAQTADLTEMVCAYCRKYAGVGLLETPNGKQAAIMTVWILRNNLPPPILVTAYPGH